METQPTRYEAPGDARNDNVIDDGPWEVDIQFSLEELALDEPPPELEIRGILGALTGPEAMADLADAQARADDDDERVERSVAVGVAVLGPLLGLALYAIVGY
jgi:hypothetical protein